MYRSILRVALSGIVVVSVLAETGPGALDVRPEKPGRASLLLVTIDTTRADHLGCYGATRAETPNLDRLAREGVRFEQALSPVPLTLPSHASMMTGTLPRRHGVRDNALFRLGEHPDLLSERLQRSGYRTAAFVSSVVLDRIGGLDRGFDQYDDIVRIGSREAFDYSERAASQTNEVVLRSLDSLREPFFLWVHYFDPHLPYVPPPPFSERFADRPYDGEIAFMDQQLGRLVDAVRARTDGLVVAVAGDHGESLGEHGEEAHGIFLYQATQRVPLILAGSGLPHGTVVREPVGLVDLAPTLLDLLGLTPLADANGRSLVPLIRGRESEARDYELESLFPFFSYGWAPLRALVRRGHKFIEAPHAELYRLDSDPHEERNLLASEIVLARDLAGELSALTEHDDDVAWSAAPDAELAEHRRRLESLGYLSGHGVTDESAIDPKEGIAWIADLAAGRRAYQTGDPAGGIAPLRRLLQRNPRNVPALLSLGLCYLASGDPERATETHRRALELRPDDDLVHFNLANALAALGELRPSARVEAGEHYARTLELNPRFADAYLNYASFLERGGAIADALAVLRRGQAEGVRDPELETRIAVIALKRGDVEAAKDGFRRALELHPSAANPLEAMARITERQQSYVEAADYYERLLSVRPSAPTARALGRIRLEKLGDREGARRAFSVALSLMEGGDPDRSELQARVDALDREPPR